MFILQSNKLIMEFDTRSCCDSEEECDQNSSLDPVSAESILMMELGDHDCTFDPYRYKGVYCNFVKRKRKNIWFTDLLEKNKFWGLSHLRIEIGLTQSQEKKHLISNLITYFRFPRACVRQYTVRAPV